MKAFKLTYLFPLDRDAIERMEVVRNPSSAGYIAQLSPLLNDDDAGSGSCAG